MSRNWTKKGKEACVLLQRFPFAPRFVRWNNMFWCLSNFN